MGLQWAAVVVNAVDPTALGRWWADALGWGAVPASDGDVHIRPEADSHPEILFVAVPDPKQIQNRLHLDFRPENQDAEVERLLGRGARMSVRASRVGWCSPIPRATSSVCSRVDADVRSGRRRS